MQTEDISFVNRVETIRRAAMSNLASVPDYASAIDKCERSVWTYIKAGLPVTYIGRTAYIVLDKAGSYWADRARQHIIPKRGRPRRTAA